MPGSALNEQSSGSLSPRRQADRNEHGRSLPLWSIFAILTIAAFAFWTLIAQADIARFEHDALKSAMIVSAFILVRMLLAQSFLCLVP